MEPIRVRGSLWRHRIRPIRACHGDSAHAETADPSFDATCKNVLAYLSYLCARVKLDVFAVALAQLLTIKLGRTSQSSFPERVCREQRAIFFVHFAPFVLQLLALCESW